LLWSQIWEKSTVIFNTKSKFSLIKLNSSTYLTLKQSYSISSETSLVSTREIRLLYRYLRTVSISIFWKSPLRMNMGLFVWLRLTWKSILHLPWIMCSQLLCKKRLTFLMKLRKKAMFSQEQESELMRKKEQWETENSQLISNQIKKTSMIHESIEFTEEFEKLRLTSKVKASN